MTNQLHNSLHTDLEYLFVCLGLLCMSNGLLNSGVEQMQGVFAVIAPGRVVPNLVAGAIAEAGAQQAGDMMQDFKTAHLLGVCPRAQFYAMLMGSFASVFVSVGAYALYTSAFQIPGPEFPAPTAEIWLDMAELVRCLATACAVALSSTGIA